MATIITGGSESTYLDSATRTRLWALAERLGIKRNELVKDAIKFYLDRQETKKEGK
jgi:predicted transcriptional regulator